MITILEVLTDRLQVYVNNFVKRMTAKNGFGRYWFFWRFELKIMSYVIEWRDKNRYNVEKMNINLQSFLTD